MPTNPPKNPLAAAVAAAKRPRSETVTQESASATTPSARDKRRAKVRRTGSTISVSSNDDGIRGLKEHTRAAAENAGIVGPKSGRQTRFERRFPNLTPEEILEELSKGWRSDVYLHFEFPTVIRNPNGTISHRFMCKKHSSKKVDRPDYQESTGNLVRHVNSCDPSKKKTPAGVQLIEEFAAGVTYTSVLPKIS
ncbi:uncharacterized protein BXZ73DRAFT_105958 [Epithele typhae]|uniref:uncharacterized protein n=1 Tax=Epithele typhae TaxID=378194 RepID=UPI002008E2D5|nr:uncharacterized protein BXZ73DRAFT_105958 [Epithele typhae]KAH9916099.1 hypothetical protein BXZ73DRAFT_105958 [Epithele typhae]